MEEIKKINNTSLPQQQYQSKDNYALLKDKYAKFLSDMQKSEMNNSITRFENELTILDELLIEAEKCNDKAAIEEYTKKMEEIEKKISSMSIELSPAINNGIFYRPAINIVPDVNDGSKQEKIYALSKFYTIGENGEEYPLFTKREIKEFLKDEKVYNSILNLCNITRDTENGSISTAFDAYSIKSITYHNNIEITKEDAQKIQEFANLKHTPFNKEEYYFSSLSSIVEIVKEDGCYENAKKLLNIKHINKKDVKEEIFLSPYVLSKFCKTSYDTNRVIDLLKYRVDNDKESRPILSSYELDEILKDESKYNNAKKILEAKQKLSNSGYGSISSILSSPKNTQNCVKLLELKNANDEAIFEDFYIISRLATSNINFENPDIIYLLTSLSEICDDDGNRIYSEQEIRQKLELTQYHSCDDILRISNIFSRNENGKLEALFAYFETQNILNHEPHRKEHILRNAEKIMDMTYYDNNGVEKSIISKELALYLLLNTGIEINEKTQNFFRVINETAKEIKDTNSGETIKEPIITEDDIRKCPIICEQDLTAEKIHILENLLDLNKTSNGLSQPIFNKDDLIIPGISSYIPEKNDDNLYRKIIDVAELIGDGRQSTNGNSMYPVNLLITAKNNDFVVNNEFKEAYSKLMNIKSEGISFLGEADAIQCCIKNIDISKIEKLSQYKKVYTDYVSKEEIKDFNFDKYSIQSLLNKGNKISEAIKLSEIHSPYENDKALSFFDGRTIVSFLETEPNFRYTEDFEKNINNILAEINKNCFNEQDCNDFVKTCLLKTALYNSTTNSLIKNLKEYNGDIITAIKLGNEYENLDKKTFERISTLRNYQIYAEYDKKYSRAFSPEVAKNISVDDNLYENITNFIKNCETTKDGIKVLPAEITFIVFQIEHQNIKIDNKFLEDYNNLMTLEFNGEKFLRESTAVDLLNKKEIINDILSLSEFKKTFYSATKDEKFDAYTFNKYTIFSFIDNPKLIEPAKKLASIKYITSDNKEVSVLSGHSILNIVKKLSSYEMTDEFYKNLNNLISQVEDDDYKTLIDDKIENIIDKCLNSSDTDEFIKLLKLFNGNLDLCIEIDKIKNVINKEELNLMANIAKFQKYDENTKKYESIFDINSLRDIVRNKDNYDRILMFLEKTSQKIDNKLVSKFDIETIKLLVDDENLCDTVLNVLPQKLSKEHLEKYQGQELIYAAKFIEYQNKENINELNLKEKRKLISLLIKSNIDLFNKKQLHIDFPLLPNSKEEYCTLLPKLVKSIGIETKPISEDVKNKFLNEDLFNLASELKKVNFDKLQIKQKISTEQFVEQIQAAQKTYNISDKEMTKVFDYFAFEIKNNDLVGYPANLQNGKKLEEISDPNTKYFINEVVRKIVVDYTEKNPITTNYSPKLDSILNDVIKVLPELHTIVSKPQHATHSYDVLVHSLKVLKEITTNPQYTKLNDEDKQILIIASLLHDITKQKGAVDKTHPKESSFDAFFICSKLNLSKGMESKIYDLIKNHDWTEKINRAENKDKAIEDFAFEFRNSNLLKLANIFSAADLKAVRKNDEFYNRFKFALEDITKRVDELIKQLQDTQPLLPNTVFPKASEIKDGKGVYRTKDGVPIIKINEVENLEEIGFPKGTTRKNLKFLVHGLDSNTNLANFNTFSMIDSQALLSTSYIINPYSEYHVFRPQGVILNCDTMDVHAGSNMDYGSGCKKSISTLKEQYIFGGSNYRGNDRTFFSELLKVSLGTSDEQKASLNSKFKRNPRDSKQIISKEPEQLTKEEYRKLIEEFQNKSFAEIQNENPQFADELIKIFNIIENCNRSHGRKYNEVLVTRPKIQGVFMFDTQDRQITPEVLLNESGENSINHELVKFAKENDLPVIMFGN